MKKLLSLLLCIIMVASMGVFTLNASALAQDLPEYIKDDMLYAHAVKDSEETESWHHWQHRDAYIDYDDEDHEELGLVKGEGISKEKYFFLPSSVKDSKVILLNTYDSEVTIDGTSIPAGGTIEFTFEIGKEYTVLTLGEVHTLYFKVSTAEASVFINYPDADGNGTDLFSYLCEDKENDAKATGAIIDNEGNVDNTPIKKIKGRGNTTWLKQKKPFNVTYDSAVSIDGMQKTKKLSLLANYQDSALIRNRFLQDLSDAVGMPYASDSRFVDVYMNGVYLGSYQITQKVDFGKNNLIPEIDDDTHLNEDGTLKEEFPFICEVDASAGDGDYYIRTSSARCKLTLKGPEIDDGDPYHDEVLQIAKTKFDNMYNAVRNNSANMAELVDIDSLTKIMLINELGKNWDVGVSSLYFVYKQDASGNWKFFASPVWDYDNSLGNCTGVAGDLRRMGVTDYEEPTGWWVQHKPGADTSKKSSKYTILGYAARNKTIMAHAAQVWFDEFVPAIDIFNSTGIDSGELYSQDVYYSYLEGSADMNYTMGWLMTTGDWICDHSELLLGSFNSATGTFTQDKALTKYDITSFADQYAYTIDWLNTRVAWLSAQFYASYKPSAPDVTPENALIGDADLNLTVNVKDATLIQKHTAGINTLTDLALECGDADRNGTVNVKDATAVQKFVAGIEVSAPIGELLNK
ncbi:MAG: CotH kinase family protein [Ruminococcus sp.]|nr:CotH kinase family protein [Ruminococcus sp.]